MHRLLLLLCLALGQAAAQPATAPFPLTLKALPVDLEPDSRSSPDRLGELDVLGALRLDADGPFGGFSGLEVVADGRLVAISDFGRWMMFRPLRDEGGRLTGVEPATMGLLAGPDGRGLAGNDWLDAEAVRADADGTLVVSFEREHRLWRYPADLRGPPTVMPAPPGFPAQPRNRGVEALAHLKDGRWLAISEGLESGSGLIAWLRNRDGRWSHATWRKDQVYVPVDAAALPNGDVLVLERRFSMVGGFGSRLVRVALGDITAGATLSGREIARLELPLLTDNFEGLAVQPDGDGRVLLWLISDDNRFVLQKTLLLLFRYTL